MRPIAILLAVLAVGCSEGPAPSSHDAQNAVLPLQKAARGPAERASRPFSMNDKTDLLEFQLGWPAEVSALPSLATKIWDPILKHKAELLKSAAAEKAERTKGGFDFHGYESSSEYRVVGDSGRMLSLVNEWYEYTGGAHPMHGTAGVLWDRPVNRATTVAGLLDNGANRLQALLAKAYCAALDAERAKKRGPVDDDQPRSADDPFNQCPPFSDLAVIPRGPSGKPFTTLLIHADPYVAGPYVEGDYDVELPVTAAFVAALKPEYRASFAPLH